MNGPLPLPELLDAWYLWAKWISSKGRDEAEGEGLTGWFEFNWVVEDEPELAWQAILEAIEQPRMQAYLGLLAAAPLEDLLSLHGPAFIDRVEECARTDPTFAWVLGGVWQYTMPESIWERVQAVRNTDGWDSVAATNPPLP
ncbi:DUF6869 domain-containing protein [Massilia sp.]|uniref:DUF6869 domain-containing protein n=1 Tax=Massilia sp. TaxID=1882437 RepID=UPI0028A709D8|nr:hypothetical protein [Massilia sp.]